MKCRICQKEVPDNEISDMVVYAQGVSTTLLKGLCPGCLSQAWGDWTEEQNKDTISYNVPTEDGVV